MDLAYLGFSIALTVAVALSLSRYGKVFLTDVFGDARLADSVNHLLVVGFYLVSLGYVAITIQFDGLGATAGNAVELLSLKLGWVLLGLGALHAAVVCTLSRIRRRRLAERPLAVQPGARAGQPAPARTRQPAAAWPNP
jgi:hypothetical protein